MKNLDIHDGRAFVIACIFLMLLVATCYRLIDVEYIKYLGTTVMGYLFAQGKKGDVQ